MKELIKMWNDIGYDIITLSPDELYIYKKDENEKIHKDWFDTKLIKFSRNEENVTINLIKNPTSVKLFSWKMEYCEIRHLGNKELRRLLETLKILNKEFKEDFEKEDIIK